MISHECKYPPVPHEIDIRYFVHHHINGFSNRLFHMGANVAIQVSGLQICKNDDELENAYEYINTPEMIKIHSFHKVNNVFLSYSLGDIVINKDSGIYIL